MTADEAGVFGPISYLIVEFPGNKMTGEGFATLLDLVDRGVIRILDLMLRDPGLRWLGASARTPGHRPRRAVRSRRFSGTSWVCSVRAISPRRRRRSTRVVGRDLDLREPMGGTLCPGVTSRQCRLVAAGYIPLDRSSLGRRHGRGLIQRTKDETMPLLRGVARTAAIAGTATAVSNHVSRRSESVGTTGGMAVRATAQYAPQPAPRTCSETPSRS